MDINQQDNRDNRRLSGASCERIILYVDDFASQGLSAEFYDRARDGAYGSTEPDVPPRLDCRKLCPSGFPATLYPDSLGFQLDDRSALYPPQPVERSPSPNLLGSQASTPRRSRCNLDVDQRSSRRSSVQSSRSRTNSCSRPTPLGRGRVRV